MRLIRRRKSLGRGLRHWVEKMQRVWVPRRPLAKVVVTVTSVNQFNVTQVCEIDMEYVCFEMGDVSVSDFWDDI